MIRRWFAHWFPRRYTGCSAGVDYTVQFLYWVSHSRLLNWPSRATADWASRLLDTRCRCERCQQREERAQRALRGRIDVTTK